MLSLFSNRSDLPVRMQLDMKHRNARVSLLVVVAFTFINMMLRVSQTTGYFLFSANLPFFLTDVGMYFGGIYDNPTEAWLNAGFGMHGERFFYGMLAVAILIVAAYFVLWLLSARDSILPMLIATVLFGVDTLFLVGATVFGLSDLSSDFVIDLLLHAYVLYALIDGTLARRRYLALPEDAPIYDSEQSEQ